MSQNEESPKLNWRGESTSVRPMKEFVGHCQSPGGPLQNYPKERVVSIHDISFTGWSVPGFFRKKKQGHLLPLTPYTKWEHKVEGAWVTCDATGVDNLRCWHAHPCTEVFELDKASIFQHASQLSADPYVQQAASEVYAQFHDTLTFIAEFHKIIGMFTNAGRSLIGLLKGDIASSWLQYRYGWRTLWYDLVSINEAIRSLDDKRTRYSERAGESWEETETSTQPAPHVKSQSTMTVNTVKSISLRGSVVADINPPRFSMNPAVTAWELVTYSFIIDWFIDIGQWLAAASFLTFNHQHFAAGGIKIETSRSIVYNFELDDPYWETETSNIVGNGSATLLVRRPTRVSLGPQLKFDVDVQKVLDILALVFRRLSGIGGKPSGTRM